MRALLASPLGFLIGLALGALGGGGSVIAVPVLVYVAGQDPQAATATSLALVTLIASVGIVPHWRNGHVRAALGVAFGAAGLAGNLVGSNLNSRADPDVLLLAFAGVMLAAAAAMWRSLRKPPATAEVALVEATGVSEVSDHDTPPASVPWSPGRVASVLAAGTGVGLLTGCFGVGGGFVIVPALVLVLGVSMPDAVGTSLLIIVINSGVALLARAGDGGVDLRIALPFAITALAGVTVGAQWAQRRDPSSLQRAFVVLLVAVALYTAVRSIIALG
jgi:hypothetical protein